jgi:hypothetical protein
LRHNIWVNRSAAFFEDGYDLPVDVSRRLLVDAGEPLPDPLERSQEALRIGEAFKVLFGLASSHSELASWSNAIKLVDLMGKRAKARGATTALWRARRRYILVAHLWAAWSIREGKFGALPAAGYDGYDDFQSFLTEAEILRDFGQNWRSRRAKSRPPLPVDVLSSSRRLEASGEKARVAEDWHDSDACASGSPAG